MAVITNIQQCGIGRSLFEFTNGEVNQLIPENIGMLLEVPMENVFDSDEQLIRKKRIQLYSRLGVKVLKGVNYLLPLQNNGVCLQRMLIVQTGSHHLLVLRICYAYVTKSLVNKRQLEWSRIEMRPTEEEPLLLSSSINS